MAGIYIHIPFCKRKCNYCDFASCTDLFKIDKFLKTLAAEFRIRKTGIIQPPERLPKAGIKSAPRFAGCSGGWIKKFDTLYIGGGTPSVLGTRQLEKLLRITANAFGEIKKFKEATVEINPESSTPEKLRLMKETGVNRLSIGLQSTTAKRLKFLGRLADYADFLKTYKNARKAGFENINADLIYGVPGQTLAEFRKDLQRLTALRPEHISAYCLEIHKDTPLGKLGLEQDEDAAADMYRELRSFLEKKNYLHYEISNFALKDRQSRHNLNYWDRGNYLGFGPAAASHVNNKRWANSPGLDKYLESGKNGTPEKIFYEKLTGKDVLNEKIMLGLRKVNGIELKADIIVKFNNKLKELAGKGFLEFCRGKVRIKKDFLFVSNSILSEIIET